MISLVSPDDVKKKRKRETVVKVEHQNVDNIINKKYYLLRWKIKRLLIKEKLIESCNNWKTVLDVFDPIANILSRDDIKDSELKEMVIKLRSKLREHHTKYEEIHGEDKSIWMTSSEHRLLHNRLRREGKCNIPSGELAKISVSATTRTIKRKEQMKEYMRENYREQSSERMKKVKYNWLVFQTTLSPNIRLREQIAYYDKTGTLTVSSGIYGDKRKGNLPVIQID